MILLLPAAVSAAAIPQRVFSLLCSALLLSSLFSFFVHNYYFSSSAAAVAVSASVAASFHMQEFQFFVRWWSVCWFCFSSTTTTTTTRARGLPLGQQQLKSWLRLRLALGVAIFNRLNWAQAWQADMPVSSSAWQRRNTQHKLTAGSAFLFWGDELQLWVNFVAGLVESSFEIMNSVWPWRRPE